MRGAYITGAAGAAAGVVIGLVGLLLVTLSNETADKFHGALIEYLGLVFVLIALGFFAVARSDPRIPGDDATKRMLQWLTAVSCLIIVLTGVGLWKSYASEEGPFDAQAAWFPYALTCSFALLGWLHFRQPFAWRQIRWAAAVAVACALALAAVGLVTGLQRHGNYYNHGAGWLLAATVASALAAAAFIGARH